MSQVVLISSQVTDSCYNIMKRLDHSGLDFICVTNQKLDTISASFRGNFIRVPKFNILSVRFVMKYILQNKSTLVHLVSPTTQELKTPFFTLLLLLLRWVPGISFVLTCESIKANRDPMVEWFDAVEVGAKFDAPKLRKLGFKPFVQVPIPIDIELRQSKLPSRDLNGILNRVENYKIDVAENQIKIRANGFELKLSNFTASELHLISRKACEINFSDFSGGLSQLLFYIQNCSDNKEVQIKLNSVQARSLNISNSSTNWLELMDFATNNLLRVYAEAFNRTSLRRVAP